MAIARLVDRSDAQNRLVTVSDRRVFSCSDVTVRDERRHADKVIEARVSKDGEQLVSASLGGTLRGWRLNAPKVLRAGTPWLTAQALLPGGLSTLACSQTTERNAPCDTLGWTAEGAKSNPTSTLPAPAAAQRSAIQRQARAGDGKLLLFHDRGYDLGQIYQPVLTNRGSGQDITPDWLANSRSGMFSPTRAELAVVRAADIAVWPESALAGKTGSPAGQPLLRLPPKADVSAVALSPDGRWLATLVDSIQRWTRTDPQGKPITLMGHRGALRSVVFSPDSSMLVSASADRSIRVRDAATGHEWTALYRHGGKVNSALFDQSGEQIVSVSDDGTALVGRCDACRLPLDPLKQRTQASGRMTADDEAALKADAVSWLPRWLGDR